MDVKQLNTFVVIANCGSFTKASEFIGLAQPALGQQIRKLEAELGVTLLIRHSRGVELTEAGKLLLRDAHLILNQIEQTRQNLAEFTKGVQTVTLGVTPTASMMLAGPLLEALAGTNDQIQVRIVEEMSSVLLEWVASNRIPMALAYNASEANSLRTRPLLQEALFFVESTANASDDGHGHVISLAEVTKHKLVLPGAPHIIQRILHRAVRERGLELKIVYDIQSVSTVREFVCQGRAATVMPLAYVRKDVDAGILRARRIADPDITRILYFVQSSRRSLTSTEKKTQDLLCRLIEDQLQHSKHGWSRIGRDGKASNDFLTSPIWDTRRETSAR